MPTIKPHELKQELKKKHLRPVYLLTGEETYLLDQQLALLEKLALAGGMPDFNLDRFFARDSSAAQVTAAARTLPVMSDRRLVVVKEVDAWKAEEQEKLLPYLENPVASTCLILVAEEVDGRKKFAKAAAANGAVVEFKRPYPNQLPDLVRELAAEQGKAIDPDAVELLIELKGNNLAMLDRELEKLALYLGAEKKITREHVAEATADTRLSEIFALTDALGARDTEGALRLYQGMKEAGRHPLSMLALIARHFRMLGKVKFLMQQRVGAADIAKETGLNKFILEKTYLPQAKNFRLERVGELTAALADLDFDQKSSPGDKELIFERALIALCRG